MSMMCAPKRSVQSKRRQNGTSRGARYSQSHASDLTLKARTLGSGEMVVLRSSIGGRQQTEALMLATLVAILCNGQLCLLQVCLGQLHSRIRRLMLVISKPIVLSKEYLEAARTLFRGARNMVD
jgi:hypothetical protein